jgi:hypothetical protein
LEDGTEITNLYELSKALHNMSKKKFSSYVTKDKNMFVDWVRYTAGYEDLAEKMAEMKTPRTMSQCIKEKISRKKTKNREIQPQQEEKKPNWIKNFLFEEKELGTGKLKCGTNCPYKSFKGTMLEFLTGIIVGLTVAIVLSVALA